MAAGHDLIGSALSAGGTATLAAQRNVALLTSADTTSQSSQSTHRSKRFTAAPVSAGDAARSLQGGANSSGVSMSPYNGQSGIAQNSQQVVDETGTTVDAGQITVISRQGDITAQGARLTAQHDINVLAAQGAIDLGTGFASQAWQSHQRGHQVGDLGGNGYAGTIGERQEQHDQTGTQTWQSTLRTGLTSEEGDVNVIAHGDLTGQGVDIAGRDVTLMGRNVTLTPSADTAEQQQRDKMRQAGVTVALSGAAVQAAQAVDAAVDAHDRGDNRLAALYAAEAYYGAKDAAHVAGDIDYGRAAQSATGHAKTAAANPNAPNGDTSLVKVTVSIGSSHQSSNTSYQQQTQQGSTITASRDVTIVATGDGTKGADGYAANGDVVLQGTQIQAGRDATLAAARDITLTAGQDTTQRDSANHSGSASIGVGFALGGQQNGFTIELAAAAAQGKGNGDSTTNHATTINAGDTLRLTSGRDTTLEGAQAYGNTILADIGRNLSLTSTQDTDHYKETYQAASAGLSLCIPPICYGATSGGASYSQGNISNHYQSVTDQTGLAAGSGGFDIHVGDTTTLTGAALASTADPSRNLLDTGSLVVNDLHNSAHSSASQMGFSFSSGSVGSNVAGNAMGAALNLAIPQGGSDSSDTASSIAQGTIVVRDNPDQDLSGIDRSATTLNGNGVSNDFDVDKIKEKQELGQVSGLVAFRAVKSVVESRRDNAQQSLAAANENYQAATTDADRAIYKQQAEQAQADLKAWGDGGVNKVALQALAGAFQAKMGGGDALSGAAGVVADEAFLTHLGAMLNNHGVDADSGAHETAMGVASAGLGWLAGNVTGSPGSGAGVASTAQKYGYFDYRDGRQQALGWQAQALKNAAGGDENVRAAMTYLIDKAMKSGADPADLAAALANPEVAESLVGMALAESTSRRLYDGTSFDDLSDAQKLTVMERLGGSVTVGAMTSVATGTSWSDDTTAGSGVSASQAAQGTEGVRSQVGAAATMLIVNGEQGVEKAVNWMGEDTATALAYVAMAAMGGPVKTAGSYFWEQSSLAQWLQQEKESQLVQPFAGVIGVYGFGAQTDAQAQAVYPASHAVSSAGINAVLSAIGAQAVRTGAKGIVKDAEGFSKKVDAADHLVEDGAEATSGAVGKVDDLASTGTPVRPAPRKSEVDVGADLGAGARPQVSYKNGQEVPYGTSGSVRPDWCVGNVCSVEVKNYNIAKNQQGLINNVSKQALQRAENLPKGMQQQVVIDIRGQIVSPTQRAQIIRGIVNKSNGAISFSDIRFKSE